MCHAAFAPAIFAGAFLVFMYLLFLGEEYELMSKTYSKTRILVECALMIALGTVLANIKIYELANGGSVTLFSMVPFILVSFRHGAKWGLFTGFVNSLLQMLLGFYAPPAPGLLPLFGMIMLDYVLAFSLLGLACVFAK